MTNNPEWFLKHDLVTHPRFATSGKYFISFIFIVTKERVMRVRQEIGRNRYCKRTLVGGSEYLTTFEEHLRKKEADAEYIRKMTER